MWARSPRMKQVSHHLSKITPLYGNFQVFIPFYVKDEKKWTQLLFLIVFRFASSPHRPADMFVNVFHCHLESSQFLTITFFLFFEQTYVFLFRSVFYTPLFFSTSRVFKTSPIHKTKNGCLPGLKTGTLWYGLLLLYLFGAWFFLSIKKEQFVTLALSHGRHLYRW